MSATATEAGVDFAGPLLGGRYVLGPPLGEGGQGRTFLARDQRSDRVVCVKQFRLDKAGGWKKFDLFEREAAVLKTLDHPGIPRYLDHFQGDAGAFYLVMERAPGAPLRVGDSFTEVDLRDIGARLTDILVYLHGRHPPVIHRDIKPQNVLRDGAGRVSLVDFGGVRAALREGGGSTVVGTFGYMAPEQLHGAATFATDLYGLGATLVALAGGVEPEDVPRKGLRMDLPRHLKGLSDDFVALLSELTSPDPDARPASTSLVAERLKARPTPRRRDPAPSTAPAPPAPPVPPAPPDALMAMPSDPRGLDELRSWPFPFGFALRLMVLAVALGGVVFLTVADPMVLIIASIVRSLAPPERRPRIAETATAVRVGLRQGRRELTQIGGRVLAPSAPPGRRQLPPPGGQGSSKGPRGGYTL
jgi:serine/threonine protein kinase